MPYAFPLPTTSYVNFGDFLSSNTHPSLPLAATQARAVLRDALKSHKHLPPAAQASNLGAILSAAEAYLPYALALDGALHNRPLTQENVDVTLIKELETQWRSSLSSFPPGRRTAPRMVFKSLDVEIALLLQTIAYVNTLLAREQLRALYIIDADPLTPQARGQRVASAMQHLLAAQRTHAHVQQRMSNSSSIAAARIPDLATGVPAALGSMALADATMIAVLKDDPYLVAVSASRNKNDTDWMFKAPELSKVKAHLFARLSIAGSEHAQQALAGVKNVKGIDEALVQYLESIRRLGRARAARFLAIDAEAQGKVGEGIAWLRGGLKEVGITVIKDGATVRGFARLKRNVKERMEDRRAGKAGSEWGADGGLAEEGRVLEMLDKKWTKMNDTVNVQVIPSSDPLLANLPSGREYHLPTPWVADPLAPEVLRQLRAPSDPIEHERSRRRALQDAAVDSSDEDDGIHALAPGAFPDSQAHPSRSTTSSYY